MSLKFSDRIGVTSPPTVFQMDDVSIELRISVWNCLLEHMLSDDWVLWHSRIAAIYRYFFKIAVDDLPDDPFNKKKELKIAYFNDAICPWYQVYNLIEFLAEIGSILSILGPKNFMADINAILEEEMSGYRFINGMLAPISSPEELESITASLQEAERHALYGTKEHLMTAISQMSKKPNPDYRNSIKESISAIESLVKQITGEDSGGLDKALTGLDFMVNFHGAFKNGLLSLYGYTSDEDGIRHAIL